MEEALHGHLADNAPLAVLVGAAIQWAVREAPPSVVLHLIDAPADQTLKGPSGLVQARVQIDCWSTTFLGAKAIGDAVRAAMPAIQQVVSGVRFNSCVEIDLERTTAGEPPNLLHRTRIDFRVSYSPA